MPGLEELRLSRWSEAGRVGRRGLRERCAHRVLERTERKSCLDGSGDVDTVGGLIYHRIGGVPKPGDQVAVDGLTLTVESTDGRRVSKVLVVRARPEDGPEDDEADR